MSKKINYNYAFLFYDVNEKRVQKVFKICKKYLSHFQNSVFSGEITPSKLMKLKLELQKIIVDEEDFVCRFRGCAFYQNRRAGGCGRFPAQVL